MNVPGKFWMYVCWQDVMGNQWTFHKLSETGPHQHALPDLLGLR